MATTELKTSPNTYGLIGEHLGHSFSPYIHQQLGGYEYQLLELAPNQLADFLQAKSFAGLNVTIPYKSQVLPYLDYVEETAAKIGAVNTIVNKNNLLYGYNADFGGFQRLLQHQNINLAQKRVLILGSGGTSKTVQLACQRGNASAIFVASRTPSSTKTTKASTLSYTEALQPAFAATIDSIINTTPCGMYPNNGDCPLDLTPFTNLTAVVDVLFNPLNSTLLQQAQKRKIPQASGLFMLIAQAGLGVEHFIGKKISPQRLLQVYEALKKNLYNLVLVGMPGSGKTSLGKELATLLGKKFVDTDACICKKTDKTIPELFATLGEAEFRRLESITIQELSSQTGLVIATGGGTILNPVNTGKLQQNGIIAFVNRPLDLLQIGNGRPLSQNKEAMARLYAQRVAAYQQCCDFQIENGQQSLQAVAAALQEGYQQAILNRL